MSVTSSAERAGLLVAVITGGRPALTQRPTRRFLGECRAAGVQDVIWVVNERHAESYERDENPVVTYSDQWAFEYASEHWMYPQEPAQPGGFYGAFPGREAACREAERRGCWGVLQLDDNIVGRAWLRQSRGGKAVMDARGGFELITDVLAAITLSTNARMTGAWLTSVGTPEFRVARTGFPYSAFVEQVGAGREEWFGPFEDDITHALQYGDRADGSTSAVATTLLYQKAAAGSSKGSKDLSGMRSRYGHDRSKMLQRLNPQSARVHVRATTSNGRGDPRVFHMMPAGAIRNPLRVTDPAMWGRTRELIEEIGREWEIAEREGNREKARERLAAHLDKGAARAGGAA